MDGSLKSSSREGKGMWAENGELNVAIVTGITRATMVSISRWWQFVGSPGANKHFGHGRAARLTTGGKGRFNAGSAGRGEIPLITESSLGSRNEKVVNQTGSAKAFTTEPPTFGGVHRKGIWELRRLERKLLVHSAGTRNPSGLFLDSDSDL